MNDERLRQLYMQGLAARERQVSRGGAPCAVAPDDLLALARGELGEERRLELLDRVMVNERCRQELDLLRAVVAAEREALSTEGGTESGDAPAEEEPAPVGESAPAPIGAPALRVIRGGAPPLTTGQARVADTAPRRAWWRHAGLTSAVAATLLLAVGVSQFLRAGRTGSGELTRGAGDGVSVVAPGNTVEAGVPVTFAWRPVTGATRYALDLSDADGNAVYETTTRDTTVALPAAVSLRAGVDYRWIVRALDDAGAPRGTTVRRLAVRER